MTAPTTAGSETFGAFLVRNQLVTQKIVEEAIQNQSLLGGRLGTNLIELGALTIEQLEGYLGKFLNMPSVGPKDLDAINPQLLHSIPRRLIDKYRFLPLAKQPPYLKIAVMNPLPDAGRQEIEAVLNTRLMPHLACEIRVLCYLDQYLGIPTEIRYRSLFFHYRKSKALGKNIPLQIQHDEGKLTLLKKGFKPLEKGEELTDDGFEEYLLEQSLLRVGPGSDAAKAKAAAAPTPTPPVSAAPPKAPPPQPPPEPPMEFASLEELEPLGDEGQPITIDELHVQIAAITDRHQIADLALRFAAQFVPSAVLFTVNAGLVSGWNARGKNLTKDSVRSIVLPESGESVLQTILETKNHFYGRLSPKPINMRLLAALGINENDAVLLIPVVMKKRPVNILLAHAGSDTISQPSQNALLKLCQWLPKAYEQVIRARKTSLSDSLKKS